MNDFGTNRAIAHFIHNPLRLNELRQGPLSDIPTEEFIATYNRFALLALLSVVGYLAYKAVR